MRRVSIVGTSGSGKSTLARALAGALVCPHVELDSIYHQPGWTELPLAEFRTRVADAIAHESWVVDGNYTQARDLVWDSADTVVWVDMPRATVWCRVFVRTIRRLVTRKTLWNGNRERWYTLINPLPKHNIVMWSIATFGENRRRFAKAMLDDRWSALDFVRLRTPADVADWLASVDGSPTS